MIHIRIANWVIEIIIFKFLPSVTAFFAYIGIGGGVGGFIWALIVAASVKVLLYFFEKEIKSFAVNLRKKWDMLKFKRKKK